MKSYNKIIAPDFQKLKAHYYGALANASTFVFFSV